MNLHRRSFLWSLFCIPAAPVAADFTLNAQYPPITRDKLNERVLALALAASRVPCPNAFTILIMLSAALDVEAESSFADHCVQWKCPAVEMEAGK